MITYVNTRTTYTAITIRVFCIAQILLMVVLSMSQ
jgi:hypothetical protein